MDDILLFRRKKSRQSIDPGNFGVVIAFECIKFFKGEPNPMRVYPISLTVG